MYLLMLMLVTLYASTLSPSCIDFPPQLESHEISLIPTGNTVTSHAFSISYWQWSNGLRLRPTYKGRYLAILCLLLSGQVETNPGPPGRTPKFPCGECGKAVTWAGRSVACDRCDKRYHKKCLAIITQNFNVLTDQT